MKFEDLPIILDKTEFSDYSVIRVIKENGTIADLLKVWDIDDPDEDSEMAQVLRHLRNVCKELEAKKY